MLSLRRAVTRRPAFHNIRYETIFRVDLYGSNHLSEKLATFSNEWPATHIFFPARPLSNKHDRSVRRPSPTTTLLLVRLSRQAWQDRQIEPSLSNLTGLLDTSIIEPSPAFFGLTLIATIYGVFPFVSKDLPTDSAFFKLIEPKHLYIQSKIIAYESLYPRAMFILDSCNV